MKQQSFIRHTVERTAAITSGTFAGILGSCAEHSPKAQFIGSLHIQMSNHLRIEKF